MTSYADYYCDVSTENMSDVHGGGRYRTAGTAVGLQLLMALLIIGLIIFYVMYSLWYKNDWFFGLAKKCVTDMNKFGKGDVPCPSSNNSNTTNQTPLNTGTVPGANTGTRSPVVVTNTTIPNTSHNTTTPSAPSAPTAPSAPAAPTAPSAPTAPTAPSAPSAPTTQTAPVKSPLYVLTGTSVSTEAVKTFAPSVAYIRLDTVQKPDLTNFVDSKVLPTSDTFVGMWLTTRNLVVDVNGEHQFPITGIAYQTIGLRPYYGIIFQLSTTDLALSEFAIMSKMGWEGHPLTIKVYDGSV